MRRLTDTDKTQILKLHKKGKSSEEIRVLLKYKFTRQQIAAVKAWHTMHTISKPVTQTRTLTDSIRHQIIGMIYKGKETSEIMRRLKYKYSRQQIAAVRAHMTMGNY